jgi:DNA-binding beta-propeller fold protein YncE
MGTAGTAHAQAAKRYPHTLRGPGTFGGPSNFLNLPGVSLTGRGTLLGSADAQARLHWTGAGGSATLGTLPRVLVGNTPQDSVFDPATDTVYVANQVDNTISVVNARTCNARHTAGCGQAAPAFPAGNGPFSVAVNDATRTLYVTDGNTNSVSVFSTATCNAADTAGCRHITATLKTGDGPAGIAVDPATDTLYVTDAGAGISGAGDTVSVINGATCNAGNTSGCAHTPATVTVGHFPFLAAFDPANKTVYVTDALDNAVSMINTRTCRARHTAGCGHKPPTASVGNFPVPVVADAHTNTVYVGNANEPTVSLINGATCNATDTSGCSRRLATLHVEGGPDGLVINQATHTLFVANNGPGGGPGHGNTISVVNAATCNARNTSGCGQKAPLAVVGVNPGGGTVDQKTNTLYVTTFDYALSIINGATCNARVRTGCGQPVPATVTAPPAFSAAVNQATHSIYIGGGGEGVPFAVSVLNARTCNPADQRGCTPHQPAVRTGKFPFGVAVDQANDTIYATNFFNFSTNQPGHTVSVINGATCNAQVTSGCSQSPATATVDTAPAGIAVNQATQTVYVANSGAKTLSIINAAECNGTHPAGCRQLPHSVHLAAPPWTVAVNQATDTIYVLHLGAPATVSVINGATCNATDTSGCGQTPRTVTVGNASAPEGLAVDQDTDTIYVANTGDDTISVIDGATCNGHHASGCGQTPKQVRTGRQNFGFVAVDALTNLVYVSNGLDDTISVINGKTCNGQVSSGCGQNPPTVPAGGNPAGLIVNQADHTVYVTDNGAATVSFFRFQLPQRPTGVTATAQDGKVWLRWRRTQDGGLPIIYEVIPTPACPACRGLNTPSTSGQPFTTITGLSPGKTYTFKIKAINAAGTGRASAPSNSIRA